MPDLRNSNETDKKDECDDKKSPSLSLTVDDVYHEAYHDLMKTGCFLEVIFLLCLDDDLMDLLRYDELDLVFKVPRTFESRFRGNQNLKRRKLVLNSRNDIRLFILSFVRLFFLLLFLILKQQE